MIIILMLYTLLQRNKPPMSVPIIAFLVEDDDSGLHLEYDEEEGSQWRWQWIIGGTLTAPFPVTAPTLFRVADWDHTVDETLLSEELAEGSLLLPPVSCLKHELLPVGVNYGAMGVAGDNVFSYRQIVDDKIHYDGKEIHISLASNPPGNFNGIMHLHHVEDDWEMD